MTGRKKILLADQLRCLLGEGAERSTGRAGGEGERTGVVKCQDEDETQASSLLWKIGII